MQTGVGLTDGDGDTTGRAEADPETSGLGT
jgi:hypothetical protein